MKVPDSNDDTLVVRIPKKEKKTLQRLAKKKKITLSYLVRWLIAENKDAL